MATKMNSANRLQSPSLTSSDTPHSPRTDMSSVQHLNNIFSAVRRQVCYDYFVSLCCVIHNIIFILLDWTMGRPS
jgi:hypothetical protein